MQLFALLSLLSCVVVSVESFGTDYTNAQPCPTPSSGTCTNCPFGTTACAQGGCQPNGSTQVGYCDLGTTFVSCGYCPSGQTSSDSAICATVTSGGTPIGGSVSFSCSSGFPFVPTASTTSSGSCFSASETLVLESGESISMDKIQVGDRVMVATQDIKTSFSPVIVLPHAMNSEKASFVHLFTESGRDVKMTVDHLVMGGACGAVASLQTAGSLQVGECVQTVAGPESIKSTTVSEGFGVYTAVTASVNDLLVVNGVIASPFASNHLIANSFYNIHRAVYKYAPSVASHPVVAKVLKAFGDVVVGVSH